MRVTEVQVPFKLLVARDLTSSAKVLWIVLHLDRSVDSAARHAPTRLSERTGFTRQTVRNAMAQLAITEWGAILNASHPNRPMPAGPRVWIPIDLLIDGSIHSQARVVYGVIQRTPGFRYPKGAFTYASLGELAQLERRTVKKAIDELAEAGWIDRVQRNKHASIQFTLRNPVITKREHELAQVRRRIERARFRGEAIMRAYLSLIVDSEEFEDDAAPGFLVNPLTDERLQFDRYYPPKVAFEFNGPQHYGETKRFSAEDAAAQRARDLIKTGICSLKGITLVVVHPDDLTLKRMQEKVGRLLPLRHLAGREPVINYLEVIGRSYRRAAKRAFKP